MLAYYENQGGLLDIELHPDYTKNDGFIYVAIEQLGIVRIVPE